MATYNGTTGNDTYGGTAADDDIFGLAGNDTLNGTDGNDTIDGGADNDYVDGGLGADSVAGGAGHDHVFSGPFDPSLPTASGLYDNGTAVDTLSGGTGDDTLYAGFGDFVDGGDGTDVLTYNFAGSATGVNVDFETLFTGGTLDLGGGTLQNIERFAAIFGTAHNDVINVTGGIESWDSYQGYAGVYGGAGDDSIIGGAGTNNIGGGDGNDTIDAGGGDDYLYGGSGIDTVSYVGAGAAVTVDLGKGLASGGAGSDTVNEFENVVGSLFADRLTGNAGDNLLQGGSGADTLEGALGNDTLNGGGALDTASYDHAAGAVTVSLAITAVQNTGGAGTDTLIAIENLIGSDYNDVLTGSTDANAIGGGAGNDTLNGGAGDDNLLGGLGNDFLVGGAGFDTASYATATGGVIIDLAITDYQNTQSAGMDRLLQIENIRGSGFEDVLKGNAAVNNVNAAEGNDVVYGYAGNDTLLGGAGNDTLSGGDSQDTIQGGDNDDIVYGDAGIDNLKGDAGNDTLSGGTDNDTIAGGDGNDVLAGEGGRDVLVGGAGADRFVYTATTESAVGVGVRDQIRDFNHADGDRIDLSGIDAVAGGGGNEAFTFIGTGAFTGVAGQLNIAASGDHWVVQGDVNGDGAGDFAIQVTIATQLVAGDFLL
jgi:Ca2+-binding RTX toxin-like protein